LKGRYSKLMWGGGGGRRFEGANLQIRTQTLCKSVITAATWSLAWNPQCLLEAIWNCLHDCYLVYYIGLRFFLTTIRFFWLQWGVQMTLKVVLLLKLLNMLIHFFFFLRWQFLIDNFVIYGLFLLPNCLLNQYLVPSDLFLLL